MSRNEYDRGVNTFSPEGRLFQVEYALGAVQHGTTSIAAASSAGAVLVTERKEVPAVGASLIEMDKGDARKILMIDEHIAASSGGIAADARVLANRARVEAANHRFSFNEPIGLRTCANGIAKLILDFSGVWESHERAERKKMICRPFGCALMLIGRDKDLGPQLWIVDPSGSTVRHRTCAVGNAYEGAEHLLQERYREDMSFDELEVMCLSILRQGMEEKMTHQNVEVCAIQPDGKINIYSGDQIVSLIGRLPEISAQDKVMDDARSKK